MFKVNTRIYTLEYLKIKNLKTGKETRNTINNKDYAGENFVVFADFNKP